MRRETAMAIVLLAQLAACVGGTDGKTPEDTGKPADSHAETGDSGQTDSPGDTTHSGDTSETGETGLVIDTGTRVDADGDGYYAAEDCDDSDAAINPGAEELWDDGTDQDCDGDDACDTDGDGQDRAECGGEDCDDHDTDQIAEDDEDELALGVGPVCGTAYVSAVMYGEDKGDAIGNTTSYGDINGDGLTDLLIGAASKSVVGTQSGVGYVVYSPVTGEKSLADADAMILGSSDEAYGGTLWGLGDTNGDGYDDLVNTPIVSGEAIVNLFLGPLEGEIAAESGDATFTNGERYTYALTAGDVTGDGLADMLVEEFSTSGTPFQVNLLEGPMSDALTDADAVVTIIDSGTDDNYYAIRMGDTNADGQDDFVLLCQDSRTIYLILGGASGTLDVDDADSSWTLLGWIMVHKGGDLNADGYDEIIVNDQDADSAAGIENAGAAWIYLGPIADGAVDETDPYASWEGEDAGGGLSVGASGFDSNGDGADEFLLHDTGHSTDAERIVLSVDMGTYTTSDAGWTIMPYDEPYADSLGSLRSSAAGDTNGDGYGEVLFGESTWGRDSSSTGSGEGAVWLFLGGDY